MSKNVVNTKKTNDFAVLGLIFSIFVGLPGLIFSIIGLNRIKKTGESGKGFAIAGIIIGILNIIMCIVAVILFWVFFGAMFLALIGLSEGYTDDYDYDYDYSYSSTLTDREKCNSYWTDCEYSDYYCESYGCWCTYDDGDDYDYLYCESYYFD